MTFVLEANKLAIGYGKSSILHDFNAKVKRGEFIVVLGPNGAGKTSLLKTMLGVLKPIKGDLKILGHYPHQDCAGIGFMPQQLLSPELHHFSAYTLLSATAQADSLGLPFLPKRQKEEITFALQEVDGLSFCHKAFLACSGGQQRRIMLAQALLSSPKLLLLDEPLANLDLKHQENFVEILSRLNQRHHVTIIMTAHDINPLLPFITRVLYLANGKAVLGSLSEVLNANTLTELYQTPIEVIHYQGRYFVVHKETGYIENVCCEHI